MRSASKQSSSSSSYLWSSFSFIVLLLVLPLFLISKLAITLGEAGSFSWPSWRSDNFLGTYYRSPVVFSTERPSDQLLVAAESPLISSSKPNEQVLLPQVIVSNNYIYIYIWYHCSSHRETYLLFLFCWCWIIGRETGADTKC